MIETEHEYDPDCCCPSCELYELRERQRIANRTLADWADTVPLSVARIVSALAVGAVIGAALLSLAGCGAVAPLTLPVVYEAHAQAEALAARVADVIGWLRWVIAALGGTVPGAALEGAPQ